MEKYRIIKPIGNGAYGEVFLVRNNIDKKKYVMKKIYLKEKEKTLDTLHEVKVLSQLRHPNIVEFYESFQLENRQYLCIIMAYCETGDLFSRIKSRNGELFEEDQILDWFIQISLALLYMHKKKVIHRDLKTQNIFLTKRNIVKIGDFGISRVLNNSMDLAKTMIGTPYYMSPEVFENKSYDYKSDIWSLGCCLYEIITLKHAFDAKEMPTLILQILKGQPLPIPQKYSDNLQNLVSMLLEKDPSLRPSVYEIFQLSFIKKHIENSLKTKFSKNNVDSNFIYSFNHISLDSNLYNINSNNSNSNKNNNGIKVESPGRKTSISQIESPMVIGKSNSFTSAITASSTSSSSSSSSSTSTSTSTSSSSSISTTKQHAVEINNTTPKINRLKLTSQLEIEEKKFKTLENQLASIKPPLPSPVSLSKSNIVNNDDHDQVEHDNEEEAEAEEEEEEEEEDEDEDEEEEEEEEEEDDEDIDDTHDEGTLHDESKHPLAIARDGRLSQYNKNRQSLRNSSSNGNGSSNNTNTNTNNNNLKPKVNSKTSNIDTSEKKTPTNSTETTASNSTTNNSTESWRLWRGSRHVNRQKNLNTSLDNNIPQQQQQSSSQQQQRQQQQQQNCNSNNSNSTPTTPLMARRGSLGSSSYNNPMSEFYSPKRIPLPFQSPPPPSPLYSPTTGGSASSTPNLRPRTSPRDLSAEFISSSNGNGINGSDNSLRGWDRRFTKSPLVSDDSNIPYNHQQQSYQQQLQQYYYFQQQHQQVQQFYYYQQQQLQQLQQQNGNGGSLNNSNSSNGTTNNNNNNNNFYYYSPPLSQQQHSPPLIHTPTSLSSSSSSSISAASRPRTPKFIPTSDASNILYPPPTPPQQQPHMIASDNFGSMGGGAILSPPMIPTLSSISCSSNSSISDEVDSSNNSNNGITSSRDNSIENRRLSLSNLKLSVSSPQLPCYDRTINDSENEKRLIKEFRETNKRLDLIASSLDEWDQEERDAKDIEVMYELYSNCLEESTTTTTR